MLITKKPRSRHSSNTSEDLIVRVPRARNQLNFSSPPFIGFLGKEFETDFLKLFGDGAHIALLLTHAELEKGQYGCRELLGNLYNLETLF